MRLLAFAVLKNSPLGDNAVQKKSGLLYTLFMEIWFGSGNAHKKQELAEIFAEHRIKTPAEAGFAFEPEETGKSFLENALIKATALFKIVKSPVIADDSGLCVDALGGRPGIYSARYAGNSLKEEKNLSASEKNALILKEMENIQDRKARFVCAMVLFLSEDRFFAAQETLEGEIIKEERGAGGFGYDPIFFLPDLDRAVAELSEAEKNRLSHRAKAASAIKRFLEDQLLEL
jgi:XTP/dITP diphosphohydrolase